MRIIDKYAKHKYFFIIPYILLGKVVTSKQIARELNIMTGNSWQMIKSLLKYRILTRKLVKKTYYYSLTDQGTMLAEILHKVFDNMKEEENNEINK